MDIDTAAEHTSAEQTSTEQTSTENPSASTKRRQRLTGVLWALHWLLRMFLALSLLPYACSKVFHVQMGYADYSDAIVQYGEMSPMGLLWRFVAFSPTVQMLAGLAELLAVVLLLFGRTAWLGALIAALDMSIVFLLNLTFDVPVKQLSGIMALTGVILLIPHFTRLARFLLGRPTGPARVGQISSSRIFRAITRWTAPILAAVIIIGSGVLGGLYMNWGKTDGATPLSGVYTVSASHQGPAVEGTGHTVDEITQIAFSQHSRDRYSRVSIRYSNGDFQDGSAAITGDTATLELYPVRSGPEGLIRDSVGKLVLNYQKAGNGEIEVRTDGTALRLHSDEERRFLFDRDFSWGPSEPVNR